MQERNKTGNEKGTNLIERRLYSPAVGLIVTLSVIGGIAYLIFLLQPQYRGDILPYSMVILAEVFLIMQGMLSFWTIMNGRMNPRGFEYHNAQDSLFGKRRGKTLIKDLRHMPAQESRELPLYIEYKRKTVDVFIPVYGEDVDEIKQTAIAARDMYGQHETYILDDGESEEVRKMAAKIGVNYIRRPEHDHAKAGNINYALKQTSGALFVILDADFVARPEFLYETVPFFEDRRMAFVQTPQYYDNTNNFVSTAAGYMQHVFYAMVMNGKNKFNAAFCVGTNVVFRRSAIVGIGGIYEQSKSEDIWTALKLHENGWRSMYINKVLAVGKTPETFKAYTKQQLRWATGSFEIFFKRNPLFNFKLSIDQRLQYLATTIFYFNGLAVFSLLILPALQIYFNLTPIALGIPLWQWALLYSGFYLLQITLSFYAMGGWKLQTIVISVASFPVYIKALFNALIGKDTAWVATNSLDSRKDSPFNYIRAQTYVTLFLVLTMIVGTWKAIYTQEFSISLVWNALNTLIFVYFTYQALKETATTKKALTQLKEVTV